MNHTVREQNAYVQGHAINRSTGRREPIAEDWNAFRITWTDATHATGPTVGERAAFAAGMRDVTTWDDAIGLVAAPVQPASVAFPSRVTCYTFTVRAGDEDRPPVELQVQEIRQKNGSLMWAIFQPGAGVWTRARNGFVLRYTVDLCDGHGGIDSSPALWMYHAAMAEVQVAAAFRLAEVTRK